MRLLSPTMLKKLMKIIGVLAAVFFVLCVLLGILLALNGWAETVVPKEVLKPTEAQTSAPAPKTQVFDPLPACACAQDRVTSFLKSPGSAQFQNLCYDEAKQVEGERNYVVTSYVDSQNGFGALLRSYYRCYVHVLPNNQECDVSCKFLKK